MTISIEKNIPITPIDRSTNRKYPIEEMEVGDSFVVHLSDTKCKSLDSLMQSLNSSGRSSLGRGCLTMRTNNADESIRVWRVK